MNTRGLLIASLLLAALGGVLYWSNHHKKSDDTDPAKNILSLNQDGITGLTLKRKSGEEEILARDKDKSGVWRITSPRPLNANAQIISEMISLLSALKADHIVEDKATDLAPYGLAPPALMLTISESDGKTHKLLIGDSIPAGTNFYAALDGDPRIFALTIYDKTSLDKSVKDLVDIRLMPAEATRIDTLELTEPNKDIAFTQKNGEWHIQKPQELRADEYQVSHFFNDLEGAQIDLSRPADASAKAAAAFASATSYATIRVIDDTGAKTLEIHKTKDGVYLGKSSVAEGVYALPGNLAQDLDKTIENFSSKKLFDFGFVIPDQIDIHDGSKAYSLVRLEQQWSSNGKKLEPVSVEYLSTKIRDLTASRFVQSGFTTSSIDITVATNDHHHVEKVQIAKNGNQYIAKRENDSALYELDPVVVADLETAAANVKPAEDNAGSGGSGSGTH